MRKMNSAILVAALMLLAWPAHASHPDYEGFYIGAYGGASFLQDADIVDGSGIPVEASFDPGFVVGATGGYALSNGSLHVRFEGDINYRGHQLDDISLFGIGLSDDLGIPIDGDASALGFLANAWFDITTGTPVTPYLGGGLGVALISLNDIKIAGVTIVDDDDTVLAWQLGGGIAWAVTPQLDLSLDYRWFATEDPGFTSVLGGEFDSEYSTHNIMAGARFRF